MCFPLCCWLFLEDSKKDPCLRILTFYFCSSKSSLEIIILLSFFLICICLGLTSAFASTALLAYEFFDRDDELSSPISLLVHLFWLLFIWVGFFKVLLMMGLLASLLFLLTSFGSVVGLAGRAGFVFYTSFICPLKA